VLNAFKAFISDMSTADTKVKVWLTDGYTSFLTDEIKTFCDNHGIQKRHIVAYNSNSNSISERAWQTIMSTTRALLKDANFKENHWFVAAKHAAYIHNRVPRKYDERIVWEENKDNPEDSGYVSGTIWDSPFCRVYGRKPDVTMLRKFGCNSYPMIAPEIRKKSTTKSKLMDVAVQGQYCGIATNQKGFIIYAPKVSINKYVASRNCKFNEQEQPANNETKANGSQNDTEIIDTDDNSEEEEEATPLGGEHTTSLTETATGEGGVEDDTNSDKSENKKTRDDDGEVSTDTEEQPLSQRRDELLHSETNATVNEDKEEDTSLPENPTNKDRPAREDEKRCGNRSKVGEGPRCNRPFYHNGPHSWELNEISWDENLCNKPSSRLRSSVARTVGVRQHRADSENEEDQEIMITQVTTDCHDPEYSDMAPTFNPEAPPFNCIALATATGKERYFHSPEGMSTITVPKNYREARKHKDWEKFENAMKVEMENHSRHGTWKLVSLSEIPHNRRVCKSMWVYDVKRDALGGIKKHKARFVACGYSQKEGYDYYAQHAFTIRMERSEEHV
jgi:hypothetical protein